MRFALLALLRACTAHGLALNRRQALGGSAAAAALAADPALAASKPIAVIGSGGRTGSLCVAACLKRGLAVKALSRSGSPPPGVDADPLLTTAACDVRDPSTIDVAGAGAVIYAASGSKKGGSPHEVDNLGVVNAAKACVAAKVPRLVVISSTAVTRPDSLGYKFTDVYGKIMGEKKLGEDGIYATYAGSDLAYTIIRPGGLEEPKENIVQGPGALEISQVRRGVLIFPPRRHRRDPSAGRRAGWDNLAKRPGRGRGRGVREPGFERYNVRALLHQGRAALRRKIQEAPGRRGLPAAPRRLVRRALQGRPQGWYLRRPRVTTNRLSLVPRRRPDFGLLSRPQLLVVLRQATLAPRCGLRPEPCFIRAALRQQRP
jgi:nucleoside-diphosphate-sugar epimerase